MYIFKRWGIFFNGREQTLEVGGVHTHEFIGFLRPKICLFITGIGISGFLLFNPVSMMLLFVAIATFFVSAASYSYNLITDKEEDLINHKKVNWFVTNNLGYSIVFGFLVIGLFSVMYLSYVSFIFYITAAISAFIYSRYRVKNIFPTKNLYTGLSLTQAFIIGAANAPITKEMLLYIPSLFLLLFVISLISDLRDYEGDRLTGIRTVPVVLGYGFTKKIAYVVIGIFTASVFVFKLYGLSPLLLFVLPILSLVYLNKQKIAHLTIMVSFMCLPGGIFLMQVIS
jgi:4-hydroxybenzoate polyprenyltransferase